MPKLSQFGGEGANFQTLGANMGHISLITEPN